MTDSDGMTAPHGGGRHLRVETHGLDVIGDAERKGTPRTLFWPWFGANVSVLGLSYGSFALGFGISFWQALAAGVIGIVFSFLLRGPLGGGIVAAALSLTCIYIPQYFRVVRNTTVSTKEAVYVEAARAIGAPPRPGGKSP